MKPFSEKTTNDLIESQKRSLKNRIENLSNEEIMANDIEILTENFYQEFFIAPVTIYEEDESKRSSEQGIISKYVDPFDRDYNNRNKECRTGGMIITTINIEEREKAKRGRSITRKQI